MIISQAIYLITRNADMYSDKIPTLGTLLSELAEYQRSIEGKHNHHPGLELVQMAGIITNMLRSYQYADVLAAILEREQENE